MRTKLSDREREFVRWARVARLASVGPDGTPHVVPICPVLDGDTVVFASEELTAKVSNIRVNPGVALVFDDYVEDWNLLRQVLIRGTARVLDAGSEWERGRRALYETYRQYEPLATITEGGSVIVHVSIEHVASSGFDAG